MNYKVTVFGWSSRNNYNILQEIENGEKTNRSATV